MSVRVIFGVGLATLLAGCGGGGVRGGVEGASVQRCARLPAAPNLSVAATVTTPLVAFRRPGHGALARFGRVNANGVDTAFAVVGITCDASWLRVELPIRPNGTTGWVRSDRVRQTRVRTRIVVDLSERTVSLYVEGRLRLRSTAAIGSSATPTPRGSYYVNQRLLLDDPSGPFGPGAIGISAFSPVLTDWTQGGPVAIHGTNEPWSIGRAVSNGCIRVPNRVLRRLFWRTPSGTPVIIRA